MVIHVAFFLLGLGALLYGAETLVRGASALAKTVGLSPLAIGLTIVAFGTSAPELAISLRSVGSGQTELAVGNVIGSNIANVLLILGIAALVRPLAVQRQIVRQDVPAMIVLSLLLGALCLDGAIGRWEGWVLLTCAVGYTVVLLMQAKTGGGNGEAEAETPAPGKGKSTALILAGLALLAVGAHFLVQGATEIARALNVSELLIGLTVVAIGTSAPEIATTAVAAKRGQHDMAVGNVIGSNIYNIGLVLSLTAISSRTGLAVPNSAIWFDLPVMAAVAVACLPIFFFRFQVMRWEGALFVGYYAAYVLYLFLRARQHDLLNDMRLAMTWFVIPLTSVTVVALALNYARLHRRAGNGESDTPSTDSVDAS